MSDPRMEVIVHEVPTTVEILEDHARFEVIVNDTQIEVVSVGMQGPPGPPGPQGPPGPSTGIDQVTAPIQFVGGTLSLATGTVEGQGLIWNGSAYVTKSVIPAGSGTVPFTTSQGLGGDATNLRYDTVEQALHVTRINNTSLDGGNF